MGNDAAQLSRRSQGQQGHRNRDDGRRGRSRQTASLLVVLPKGIVVTEFPSVEQARRSYDSEEYRPRQRGPGWGRVGLVFFETSLPVRHAHVAIHRRRVRQMVVRLMRRYTRPRPA